jgi:hypothetical protein
MISHQSLYIWRICAKRNLLYFYLGFWDRFSLFSWCWPQICDPRVLASPVLRL